MISLNEDSFRLFRSDHSLPRYFSVKEEAVLVRYFSVKLVIRNVGRIEIFLLFCLTLIYSKYRRNTSHSLHLITGVERLAVFPSQFSFIERSISMKTGMFKKFFSEWISPSCRNLSMKKNIIRIITGAVENLSIIGITELFIKNSLVKNIIRFINGITVIGIIAH